MSGLNDLVSSLSVDVVGELPENADKNKLYVIHDNENYSTWIKYDDKWSVVNDGTTYNIPTKRYFFPTNCINCGNVLDKEGHCDSCGTYHNPTMVV